MALRRPVISTYIAGIPELVTNGQSGWVVPAGDIDAFADAMRACLGSSHDVLMGMGEKGRQNVLNWHNVNREAEKLAAFFKHYTRAN